MRKYIIIAIAIIIIACQKQKREVNIEPGSETEIIKIPNLSDSVRLNLSDMIDTTIVVQLETKDSSLIIDIKKIFYYKKRLYVFDGKKEISIFSITGKFIGKINRIGKGPGEYIKLYDAQIDPFSNKLHLLAHRPRVMTYDLDGNFLNERKIDYYWGSICPLPNNKMCFLNNYREIPKDNKQFRIVIKDNKYSTVASYIPFSKGLEKLDYLPYTNFYIFDNQINHTNIYFNQILQIDENRVFVKYYIDLSEQNLTEKEVYQTKGYDNLTKYMSKTNKGFIIDAFENNNHLSFNISTTKHLYTAYYSKKTKKVRTGYIRRSFMPSYNLAAHGDFFITSIAAEDFVKFQGSEEHKKNPIFKNLKLNISNYDNPILILFKLKQF